MPNKPRKRQFRPMKQGALDGFCGIYSLFNAAMIVDDQLDRDVCHTLFTTCLRTLEDIQDTIFINVRGMGIRDLIYLSKHVFQPSMGLVHTRPFYRAKPRSLNDFRETLQGIQRGPGPAGIIISIEALGAGHWTVVESRDDHHLWLADSCELDVIARTEATICRATCQRPFLINWKDTVVLRRAKVGKLRPGQSSA